MNGLQIWVSSYIFHHLSCLGLLFSGFFSDGRCWFYGSGKYIYCICLMYRTLDWCLRNIFKVFISKHVFLNDNFMTFVWFYLEVFRFMVVMHFYCS